MFTDITTWKQIERSTMDNLGKFQALFENKKSGGVIYQTRDNGQNLLIYLKEIEASAETGKGR